MAKYLVRSSYTVQGVKRLLNYGGSNWRELIDEAVRTFGGKLEAYYIALGDDDVIAILDLPDNATAVAPSLAVSACGAVRSVVTVLLTPEEIDRATKNAEPAQYPTPGQ